MFYLLLIIMFGIGYIGWRDPEFMWELEQSRLERQGIIAKATNEHFRFMRFTGMAMMIAALGLLLYRLFL